MLWFNRNENDPEKRLKRAARISRKKAEGVLEDIRMLKREYGITEEEYYSGEYYKLSNDEMIARANKERLTRYRIDKISKATGLSKEEIAAEMADAAANFDVDEDEYYEGKYYLADDIEARKKERKKEKKKNTLKKEDIKTIMDATGWSKKEALAAVEYAKENFNIDESIYFNNKYYLKAESTMARLNTARKKKEAAQKKLYDSFQKEAQMTRAQVRSRVSELNKKYEGLAIKPSEYYAYGLHKLSEEECDRMCQLLLKKKAIIEKFDGKDEAMISEFKELVRETLTDARKKQIFGFISEAMPDLKRGDERTEELLVDMQMTRELLGYQLGEYVAFKFWDKTIEERQAYISNEFKNVTLKKLNNFKGRSVSDNKILAYNLLKPYFHREAMLLESKNGYEDFRDFCSRHEKFVKKSNFDSLGIGLKKVEITEDTILRNLYDDLTENGKRILLEELIEPHPDMAFLNPNSVNTIRVSTFLDYNGEVSIQDCSMRIGRKDSFVDNAGAGGILAHVDKNTGIFDTDGVDKTGKLYKTHPDHGYVFKGYQLPSWDNFLETVTELANKVDGLRYIGWDMTCNKDGIWVVVECNGVTQFFGQQATINAGRKKALMDAVGPTLDYLEKEKAELEAAAEETEV